MALSVSVAKAGDLLDEELRIPNYQRPYSWEPDSALQLLDDITDALRAHGKDGAGYVLGSVILHKDVEGGGGFSVVDGQQRLLTLLMIKEELKGAGPAAGSSPDNAVSRVRAALRRRIQSIPASDLPDVADFIDTKCQFVRVETASIDEAFTVFDSQNYRGKALAPHDLLKAHHLRHMVGESESMTTAVVEAWESAGDADLDRLFSVYLYRIARWSRGQSAVQGFTSRDLDMFKGIDAARDRSPSARYHLAAHGAVPLLSAWMAGSADDIRDANRAQFQLDAPIPAGRPFFEMVAFMLREVKALRNSAFGGVPNAEKWVEEFFSFEPDELAQQQWKSRYRYPSEAYLAALLFYTNRFGSSDIESAKRHLLVWAYSIRLGYLTLQFRTVDGEGQKPNSPFGLIRDGASGAVLRRLTPTKPNDSPEHEPDLRRLLGELGAS